MKIHQETRNFKLINELHISHQLVPHSKTHQKYVSVHVLEIFFSCQVQ